MKCNASVKGRICGSEIPIGSKQCLVCGALSSRVCPQCTTTVTNDQKLCSFCGFQVDQNDLGTGRKKIFCQHCNTELPENSKFCLDCGRKVLKENDTKNKHEVSKSEEKSAFNPDLKSDKAQRHSVSTAKEDTRSTPSSITFESGGNKYEIKAQDKPYDKKLTGGRVLDNTAIKPVEDLEKMDNKETNEEPGTRTIDKIDRIPGRSGKETSTAKGNTTNKVMKPFRDHAFTSTYIKQTKIATEKPETAGTTTNATTSVKSLTMPLIISTSTKRTSLSTLSITRTSTAKTSTTTTSTRKTSCSEVHFYVITAPTFLADSRSGDVFIHFENDSLGGWNSHNYKMVPKRHLPEGYMRYEVLVNIPKELLLKTLYYSYYVLLKNGDKTDEYIHHFGSSVQTHRTMPSSVTNEDTIHQYDCVIRNKPDRKTGIFELLGRFFRGDDLPNLMKEEASFAFGHFLPPIQLSSSDRNAITAEEAIQRVESILRGFKTVYVHYGAIWKASTDLKQHLEQTIIDYVADVIDKIYEGRKSHVSHEEHILYLVAAVTMKEKYSKGINLKDHAVEKLCICFLPFIEKDKNKCPEFENLMSYFPKTEMEILEYLKKFVKELAGKSTKTCLFYSIPLLHFLLGKYVPYQSPDKKVNHDDRVPDWWGTAEFQNELDSFKEKSKWDKSRNMALTSILPYFEVDYLLPRTFVASLTYDQFLSLDHEHIPTEVTMAAVYFFIKQKSATHHVISDCAVDIEKIITKLTKRILMVSSEIGTSLDAPYRNYRIAADTLDCIYWLYGNNKTRFCLRVMEFFLISVDWYSKCIVARQEKGQRDTSGDHLSRFKRHREQIRETIFQEKFYGNETNFMRVCNRALSLQIPEGEIRNSYLDAMAVDIKQKLDHYVQMSSPTFIEVYCEKLETFGSIMQKILSKLAFKAVERGFDLQLGTILKESNVMVIRLASLLSQVFERNIDEHQLRDPYYILSHALEWSSFPMLLKIFHHKEYKNLLSEKCQHMTRTFLMEIEKKCECLVAGTITIKDLDLIKVNEDRFKLVVSELRDFHVKPVRMKQILSLRTKELGSYYSYLQNVQGFINLCSRFEANTKPLEKKIENLKSLEYIQLDTLCKVAQLENLPREQHYKPNVTAFGLDEDTVRRILECNKSLLFTKLWDKTGKEVSNQKSKPLEINEVFDQVWKPTHQYWNDFYSKLKSGDLTFTEFDQCFCNTDLGLLEIEFKMISIGQDRKWITIRLDQLRKYRDITKYFFGAKVIMDCVDKFQLTGNFKQIKDILEMPSNAEIKMKTMDDRLMKTCEILSGIDDQESNCLNAFSNCKNLVEWLREVMPNGMQQLNVLVELLSSSAGEGDYAIDKVNSFHSAITGYAPLIFDFDRNCDSGQFLARCQEVWKELSDNPNLTLQLVNTHKILDWLKTVTEKTHGSVEVTTTSEAKAINDNGTYRVGKLNKTGDNNKKPVFSDAMELGVSTTEGQNRLYKYENLQDLQSRVMLVSGRTENGKDEVDRFIEILDSVVNLANIYTKLVAEGCVLFSQWNVKFWCNPSKAVCASISFGNDDQVLKGKKNKGDDVSVIISKIAKFMEQCHHEWTKYIDQKREKYYQLNHFTVDQMVILQQEVVKIIYETEPSVLIYPMLSAIKHGCTKEDLIKAMRAAENDKEMLVKAKEGMNEKDNKKEETLNESVDEKIAKFLKELTKSFPVDLAREALKHVKPDDIDKGLIWCMENEEMPLTVTSHASENQKEETVRGWSKSGQSLESVTAVIVGGLGLDSRENPVDTLIKAFEDLWETFLHSISSSVSDYLSVEHLGLILKRLKEQEDIQIDRTLIPSFTAGRPNLVICPQSEIYNTVLSIYSYEAARPLPQSDEVLLCSPNTTLDMVGIFLRRAMFADNNKIYCLVNADLLDYDVSDKGERTLERLMKTAESRGFMYRLVVICSSENEYKSRIVAALDKYHRPQLSIKIQAVKNYLKTKLRVDRVHHKTQMPASHVDIERCSVRVVKSWRAGVGKSLYKRRMVEELCKKLPNLKIAKSRHVSIPLHEKAINIDGIMDILLQQTLPPKSLEPRIFHIDIYHEVQEGVDALLFQLLVLGCLGHSSGHVWRKSDLDYYIIESMPLLVKGSDFKVKFHHTCLDILPHVMCRSPQESLDILSGTRKPPDYTDHDRLFDIQEYKSATFQRPFQYLKRLDTNCKLDDVNVQVPEGDKKQCLQTLLRHCGIKDPSWAELHYFVSFLNTQLKEFISSNFCRPAALEILPGFDKFVLRFLIQMSRDFSTRSLKVSEESPIQLLQRQISDEENNEDDNVLKMYQMRRRWETSPHPYLFFNRDHHSLTFIGFNIDRKSGNLIDFQSKAILEQGIMQQNLFDALRSNNVNLTENSDALTRPDKIMKLCSVMGVDMVHDPDETYELTTDNVKKIMAIYMRFRCQIPVIIMGETGCGKTRLIKFMCALQHPPGVKVENMILMKVHGGTKVSDIVKKVKKASEIAQNNSAYYPFMDTVLFFDEANTTEAIGVIKEIMCDKTLGGKPIKLHEKLKIVAACNPYRKHSEELIKRLEHAGLGYHVAADKTTDTLGRVPMRRLVYRVQPLPQSMLPLVWDFGQLNTEVEEMYIRQMVLRYIKNQKLPALPGLEDVVSKILTVSQDFMREQKDECSFVSLRDVERVLEVMSWFYHQTQTNSNLFRKNKEGEVIPEKIARNVKTNNDVTRSLILALGVCYEACLKNKDEYRKAVANHFKNHLTLSRGANQIKEELSRCQEVFLANIDLAHNIAKNQALKENVFMMIVCIELRIPMFLVGKPGSSKSLAKTIVADAMQGNASNKALFKNFKQVLMVSYQCSPLSVPESIVGTFRQCAAYQKDKNLDKFVSMVVLDEIGLAEDSPRMPLKTLHPLLEDGCLDDEDKEPYKKVAFIGISNWALDPAKMNRGIMVQREVPDIKEPKEIAMGICSTNEEVKKLLGEMIQPMAESYLELFEEASREMREFFGLRDFYSLLKMLHAFVSKSRCRPSKLQIKHSILRNFGGLENVDPVKIFSKRLSKLGNEYEKRGENDPDCSPFGMIQACIIGGEETISESRFLLLLTENYGALSILQQKLFNVNKVVVIFGSSFPKDQQYTQVCRSIHRIKVCMETGSTVILLNMENLYESLYDALNQYYAEILGVRYVYLGLGTHKIRCRVHRKFRLIVVAEKQIVYDKFPIPLINRLEKHFLSQNTMLTPGQLYLTQKLQNWALGFCKDKVQAHLRKRKQIKVGDAFIGYNDDTCAAIIQYVCQANRCEDKNIPSDEKEIIRKAQSILLWCATPVSVWQYGDSKVFDTYFKEQHHDSLADYLYYMLVTKGKGNIFSQVTTNSKLMTNSDIKVLCKYIPVKENNVNLLTLQSFDTEQQFSRQIRSSFNGKDKLLIVQCDSGDQNANLIACARHTVQGEIQHVPEYKLQGINVVFLIQLPAIAGGCFTGFQCGLWYSVHIDELQPASDEIPSIAEMHGKSVSALFAASINKTEVLIKRSITKTAPKHVDQKCALVEDKILKPTKQFNVKYLINRCILPAISNVKDPEDDLSRTKDRPNIVLTCLRDSEGDLTFLSGITKHLTSILAEKEQYSTSMNNWLSLEISKSENVNTAGTFRRFAMHCLESRIRPLLAGTIAFIDTNKNLDILRTREEWKHKLWLQIFNDPDLTQLKYKFIVSPSRQQNLEEFPVKITSMKGKPFKSEMPFSWLIYQQIDEVLSKTINEADGRLGENHREIVMKATERFAALSLGKMLSCLERSLAHHIIKAYLVDFVHMVYPVTSEEECKLVCEGLNTGCSSLINRQPVKLLPSLFGCHMTYILNEARFKIFCDIVHVWPGCCKQIIEFGQKESDVSFLMTDQEITTDILALHLIMKHFEPNKDDLNKPDTRNEWLKNICNLRPIVESIFGHFNLDDQNKEYKYGDKSRKGIQMARLQWTRAVVVKLFIEHVCVSGKEEIYINRCMPLWQYFGNGANFKDIQSLDKVEKFLKICNRQMIEKCFGEQSKCIVCDVIIEGAPVKLPCGHIICHNCFNNCVLFKTCHCQQCHQEFPKDLNIENSGNAGESKIYQDYRRRCNSFYMEVVSQLCFAEGTPPSQEVIQKLLSYIIGLTRGKGAEKRVVSREFTIYDDSIDPTPIVRSFLLQQLMQTSDHEIKRNLQDYFTSACRLVSASGDDIQLVELCILILQCIEDSLHQKYTNRENEIDIVTTFLRNAIPHIIGDMNVLDKIDSLSKVKFSLAVVTRYVHRLYGTSMKAKPDHKVRKMFDAAAKLCDGCGNTWPRRYFVKQLCRCYGTDCYQAVLRNEASFLRWVRLPELTDKKVKECHDRYIVLGEDYKELRETVVTTVLNENSDKLMRILQNPNNRLQKRVMLSLALHREITMNCIYAGQQQKFTEKGKEFLFNVLNQPGQQTNKGLVRKLLTNTLWKLPGNIELGMDLADQNLSCLMTHYYILMVEIPENTTLLSPLQRISLDPQSMVEALYPTMPQDEMAEIKEAVLAARQSNPDENPVFYRCPNGHPYIIGDCGRPYTVIRCKECNLEIGGEEHILRHGNKKDEGKDQTETGHILGQAARLGPITAPERKLNRASFAILRLLTHIAMYIGANINLHAICQTIKPKIQQSNVARYLIDHINLDLTSIQNILGRNKDDVLILIHFLLARMMNSGFSVNLRQRSHLVDKTFREKWEKEFSKIYIEPVVSEKDNIIDSCNRSILADQRLGSDALLQILYETDKPKAAFNVSHLQDVPAVWRFRALITVNHLQQNLDTDKAKLPVLRLFLEEEHHLRAIRFVPSIIRLQKMLIQKYNRKLDRAEASTLTIGDVKTQMRQDGKSKEFNHCLENYIEAWDCVRGSLENYACPANEVWMKVDKEYCRTDITDTTPISHLIPTHKDAGLCSYVLLFFLLKKQNTFLQNYCVQNKVKGETLPWVHVQNISSAHLISYHPDRDLLPMVLANCNYSFEVGKGTRVDYDFANLERQLMDRFLSFKSIIKNIVEIETMIYRSESTNGVVLNSLCERSVQERLNHAVIRQICDEIRMKSYLDLCDDIEMLDIAINFLKSVRTEPESSLHEFMTEVLKIEHQFSSSKAQQAVCCKNTMSLWMTLALERAKYLAKYNKAAFERVSVKFKQTLSNDQTEIIEKIVSTISVELIDILVDVVFECIVLKVDVPQNPDDEDFVDMSNISLRDSLLGYIDACPFQGEFTPDGSLEEVICQLPADINDRHRILTAQCIEVWSLINNLLCRKRAQGH